MMSLKMRESLIEAPRGESYYNSGFGRQVFKRDLRALKLPSGP